jgi:hypothetical protein
MYPEDRVLVTYVPQPQDFELICRERWYRIPQRFAPKGLFAEYFAFYFGRQFAEKKWAIFHYAQNLGHELVYRRELFPEQSDHPRADQPYYKVQLGPLQDREFPIVSLRWRRITFIHTTWDRFMDAREINDLLIVGGQYVDRLYATLKERGIQAEKNYHVSEQNTAYEIPLMVPCRLGRVEVTENRLPKNELDLANLTEEIIEETEKLGGIVLNHDQM